MRTIGVISDTHGLLRSEATGALAGSDLILHAGDVGDPEILERLAAIAPVHAVYGNTDWGAVREGLPHSAVVDLGARDGMLGEGGPQGPVAFVLHIKEDLNVDPVASGFAMVVTGHTHLPEIEERNGVIHLNPGSAGPRRFNNPVTVARVEVEGMEVVAQQIVDLGVS